ncbi:S-protein homolog 2-like [Neltuma alba]|uniref:S-protein homolog 2-like n=1 Tax=Neltuma alba TaxID=207710 RepID=UPI0010A3B8C0|nr:S-protein homolog 2-like [Prosopis alba]
MAKILKSIIVLFILLASNLVDAKMRVSVTNMLDHNLDLTIHCKSKDDDLGEHLIHHLQRYEFAFGETFFGTTQFFCGFQWKGAFKWFDIYIEKRDACYSGRCNWKIKQHQACMHDGDSEIEICYPYNKVG